MEPSYICASDCDAQRKSSGLRLFARAAPLGFSTGAEPEKSGQHGEFDALQSPTEGIGWSDASVVRHVFDGFPVRFIFGVESRNVEGDR